MHILSMDFGTSSVKLAILNENVEILQETKEDYNYRVIDNDKVEIDPEVVFAALIKGLAHFDKKYLENIDIIAFDVLSPSLVTLDQKGDPIFPCILHLDRRSRKQSQEIIDKFGKKPFQEVTGVLPFSGGVSITSLLWVKENLPDIYHQTYKFGHFNTYIAKKLTGHWAIDPVNASMMGLYETTSWGGWSADICQTFNISLDKLTDIIDAGTILGGLETEAAALLNLKAGIPVVMGSNDAATAILGAGNTEEGDILNIAGSNEIATILTDKPIVNDTYYLRNSLFKNKWQIFSINIGGFAIEWFRKQAYQEIDQQHFYEIYLRDLIDNKFAVERYNKNTVRFKPYLAGDRHSLEKKRGSFTGLTLDTSREDMLIAILVGIHEPVLNNLNIASKFLTLNKKMVITGGLAESSYLDLKRKLLTGYEFEFKHRCTTIGNGKLAIQAVT